MTHSITATLNSVHLSRIRGQNSFIDPPLKHHPHAEVTLLALQDAFRYASRPPRLSHATCLSRIGSFSANAAALPPARSCCPSIRPKNSINFAMVPVQPV